MTIARFFKSARSYLTPKNINTLLRVYNFGTALLVLDDFCKDYGTENAKDAWEYGGDVAIHLIQATLTYDSLISEKAGALLLNGARLAQIPYLIVEDVATVPDWIAILDTFNHYLNTMGTSALLWLKPEEVKADSPRPK